MPTLQRGMCVAAVLLAAAMATQCQQVKHTHDRTREQIVQGLMKLSDEELHRRNQRLRPPRPLPRSTPRQYWIVIKPKNKASRS